MTHSVTRWLDYLFNIWASTSVKICQILNKPWEDFQTLFKILPNWQNIAKSDNTDDMRGHTISSSWTFEKIIS